MLGIFGEPHETGAHAGDDVEDVAADHSAETTGHGSLILLRYVRLAVYFTLGFGPLGLVATGIGFGSLGSLLWAVPCGGIAMALARAFFRWQQRDIDSTVHDHELLAERALVLVSLSYTSMGRVRVTLGQSVVERYALAEEPGETFRADDVVEVVRVTDDCVYVRRAEGPLSRQQRW
jgi:membrane protein implicated in regulation of membrane protease activity